MTDRPGESLRAALAQRYEVCDELGRGGMAIVYAGRARADGSAVAIKVLRAELALAIGSERFLREISIVRRLRHPRIVSLLDTGEADGVPYYVMPRISGENLRERLNREGQLSLPAAQQVGIDIADALAAAHAEGIVHRDIKPENVLLEGPNALVSDFGIARAVVQAAGERLTDSGLAIGTPAYMSPEQGSGGGIIDTRSDIYSLGCVLYEMLAGGPPFSGPSSQAIVARHLGEPVPRLYVVRPGIPADLEAIVRRCLAKVPADRFASAAEVGTALRSVDLAHPKPAADVAERRRRRRRLLVGAATGVAVFSAAGAWYLGSRTPLDSNRVVVFPLDETGSPRAGPAAGEGERAALLVGTALEHTEPMKWLDGWSLLPVRARDAPGPLDPALARDITRGQRGRYYVSGTIARSPDSIRVTLELHDLAGRGVPIRETVSDSAGASISRPALAAMVRLLPRLVGVDRSLDVSTLHDRQPGAILNWLQGEREYRRSHFEQALELLRRAIAADSLLVPAALRGAQAASWLDRPAEALTLTNQALGHADLLPLRQRPFAQALKAYLTGDAEGAILRLREALRLDPDHRDAWMILGEVALHLQPHVFLDPSQLGGIPPPLSWPAESLATDAFARVHRLDPGFAPALGHLMESELRSGRHVPARELFNQYRALNVDSAALQRIDFMLTCTARAPSASEWRRDALHNTRNLVLAGSILLAGPDPAARRCAMNAFRAVLHSDSATSGDRWGALLGLHGALISAGLPGESVALVDTAIAGGMSAAVGLFVVDAATGMDVGTRARTFVDQLTGDLAARKTPTLWLVGSWAAPTADTALLARISALLIQRRDGPGTRLDSLIAAAMAARLALIRGDSAGALRGLEALHPTAPREELLWSLWEPLAAERLLLARLLLARKQFARAHLIAGSFDSPGVMAYELYRAESLRLRAEAADSLGLPALAREHRSRLAGLRMP